MDWFSEAFDCYLGVLKKYTVFEGRAGRREFWVFALVSFVISYVLGLISSMLALVYGLAVFLPGLAVTVRRLHDTDKTGWLALIGLVPVIGWIVLLVLMVIEGTSGENQYGPDPSTS